MKTFVNFINIWNKLLSDCLIFFIANLSKISKLNINLTKNLCLSVPVSLLLSITKNISDINNIKFFKLIVYMLFHFSC